MNAWDAVILGLVEGITEFLPISSTGHLIIASAILGLTESAEQKRHVDSFLVVIQGGAILAVLGLYWNRVKQMVAGLAGRDAVGRRLFLNLAVATLPAAVIGLAVDSLLDLEALLFRPWPVLAALALGGIVMIILTRWQRSFFRDENGAHASDVRTFVDLENLTWRRALIIGLLQVVAIWPGTSRSMMTIVGGMVVGMRPKHAAEFSFLLGLPTLGGACLYRGFTNFTDGDENMIQALGAGPLMIGFIVATVSAFLAIRWLVGFLSRHGVAAFGWYRLVLCAVIAILLWKEVIVIG